MQAYDERDLWMFKMTALHARKVMVWVTDIVVHAGMRNPLGLRRLAPGQLTTFPQTMTAPCLERSTVLTSLCIDARLYDGVYRGREDRQSIGPGSASSGKASSTGSTDVDMFSQCCSEVLETAYTPKTHKHVVPQNFSYCVCSMVHSRGH